MQGVEVAVVVVVVMVVVVDVVVCAAQSVFAEFKTMAERYELKLDAYYSNHVILPYVHKLP